MKLTITHTTRYDWDEALPFGAVHLRLTPASNPMQRIEDWQVDVSGGKVQCAHTDWAGNTVHLVTVAPGTHTLELTARGTVLTMDTGGILGRQRGSVPTWLYERPTDATCPGKGIAALLNHVEGALTGQDREGGAVAHLHRLSRTISETVAYGGGATGTATTAEEALQAKRGVCQDHAQIFSAAARQLGYPARYVSGYLALDGGVAQDATHAWAEAYLDGLGWTGFDPTNGISPDARYVRIAAGPDYAAVSPVQGILRGASVGRMSVSVDVTPAEGQQQQ